MVVDEVPIAITPTTHAIDWVRHEKHHIADIIQAQTQTANLGEHN